MPKTPDEIKKRLECDPLSLIQQLHADNCRLTDELYNAYNVQNEQLLRINQLEAERDAAVACIPRKCGYCKHDGTATFGVDSVCDYCLNGNTRWEWRGVQKEEA